MFHINYIPVEDMCLPQLVSFVKNKYVYSCEVEINTTQELTAYLLTYCFSKPELNFNKYENTIKFISSKYGGMYPFDEEDNYIPNIEIYKCEKEEEGKSFILLSIPYISKNLCKFYPLLQRVVYQKGNKTNRLSLKVYKEVIEQQGLRLKDALTTLSSLEQSVS